MGGVESRPSRQTEKEKEFRDMAEFTWTRTITREETGTIEIDADDIVQQMGGYGEVSEASNGMVTVEYQFSVEDIYENFSSDIEWEADDSGMNDESNVDFKEVNG